ncbi:MAG TPA: hypothetical protein VK698_12775 [Kofleriaceae bacterium]|nr:hypothetical protein [Kofleriaceae bacterium]
MDRSIRRAGAALAAALTCALQAGTAGAQPPAGASPGAAQPGPDEQPVDPYAPSTSGPENQPSPDPGLEQGEPPGPPDDDIDDQVAQALYRRGVQLYRRGSTAGAKMLFVESLERSPRGRSSGEALRMLRAANRRLGIADRDDGRPGTPSHENLLDPYGAGGAGAPASPDEAPLDPYGAAPASPAPATPPLAEPAGPPDRPEPDHGSALGRRAVIAWSGAVGLIAGLAIAGPEDDTGETADGAVVAGVVGAAGGIGLSYWLTGRTPLTAGQSAAITSGATWGAASAGLIGDAATGTDSVSNDVWKYVAAGGLVGLGGGLLYARAAEPSVEDMALTDSLSVIGAGAGLCIAAGMEPPESEAFSLNALFGSAAGLAAGLLLAPRVEVSLRRTVFLDLGAAAGAALVWGLIYPLTADDTTRNDEQLAGWLSTATLAGGFGAAWYFTRGMDREGPSGSLSAGRTRRGPPPPPALARRDADGVWGLGVPFVRPMHSRALAPPGGGAALGIDLVSGRF